jgi:hypothetical protein
MQMRNVLFLLTAALLVPQTSAGVPYPDKPVKISVSPGEPRTSLNSAMAKRATAARTAGSQAE